MWMHLVTLGLIDGAGGSAAASARGGYFRRRYHPGADLARFASITFKQKPEVKTPSAPLPKPRKRDEYKFEERAIPLRNEALDVQMLAVSLELKAREQAMRAQIKASYDEDEDILGFL